MTEQSFTSFLQSFEPMTCLITPNRRLAATLIKQYNETQQRAGLTGWATPTIYSLLEWLNKLWEQYAASRPASDPCELTLLNSAQVLILWENILRTSDKTTNLLKLAETANIAQSAYQLLTQWQISVNDAAFDEAEDYLALRQWVTNFQTTCQRHQWIDSALLPDVLTDKIKTGKIIAPQRLSLIGFTEINPQLKKLLAVCESLGTAINHPDLPFFSANAHYIGLPDDDAEIETIARWASTIHVKNPGTTIGCVFPNLDKNRDNIMRIFEAVFSHHENRPFNISAGKPLSHYPVIQAALQWLSLYKLKVTRETFSQVLASPFMGEGEQERLARASIDKWLRKNNVKQIDLSQLLTTKTSHPLSSMLTGCPKLTRRLKQFSQRVDNEKHTWHVWAETFNELLTLLGWPGERSLNSEEYQTVESWLTLLGSFATLDYTAPPPDFEMAWQTLRKMAAIQTFQPQSPDAPIQILGLLEAASLPFDYLWIAGMDDITWPAPPKPNPFIPKRLQREQQMPHSTAEREYRFCSLLTEQFIRCSQNVIFSHASMRDELPLQISPLLANLPALSIEALTLPLYQAPAKMLYHSRKISTMIDHQAPACIPNELTTGGADILKQQALCPFRAFAVHRLFARELELPEPGLRASDRGNVIHKLLELLWKQLNNQSTLLAMTDEQQDALLSQIIEDALTSLPHVDREQLHLLSLEKQRLHARMRDWLTIEKSRPPFNVITSEKTTEIKLNQLTITTRPDRIDQLDDGSQIIIDYKTGKDNNPKYWFDKRPEEPQLPLYALTKDNMTKALAFAQINVREMCFKGISEHSTDIKGIKLLSESNDADSVNWAKQLEDWRNTLTQLADDFYFGKAPVDPKNAKACEYCQLTPFCRIYEYPSEIIYDTDTD